MSGPIKFNVSPDIVYVILETVLQTSFRIDIDIVKRCQNDCDVNLPSVVIERRRQTYNTLVLLLLNAIR